jgi:ATP-dependent DNA helicase RecQ
VKHLPGPPAAERVRRRTDSDDPVFEALRTWRSAKAREAAMPPYVIAHDATLQAIAEDRPRTMAGLRRVKGMGPAKLEKYGDEILAVIEAALAG